MALSIKHPEADQLARELAEATGLSLTEVVVQSLREKLERERGRAHVSGILEDLRAISDRCAALPDLDPRSPEDIIDFDEIGLPR